MNQKKIQKINRKIVQKKTIDKSTNRIIRSINDDAIELFSRESLVTIPNLLTALRIFLAPFFMFTVLNGKYLVAFVILAVAALTDFLDGLIARKFNMQSEFGRILDPIADKILVFCAVVALLLRFGFPFWLGAIIISRDVFILLAGLLFVILHKHAELKPNLLGKVSTFFQLTALTAYIVASILNYYAVWIGILLYATAAITVLSGLVYAIKGYAILKGK
jgi:cardiolipin synthase (CMP-forming)